MFKFLVVLVVSSCWFPAFAGVQAGSSFDRFMWTATGGASQTVGFGSGGTPVALPTTPILDTDGGLPRVSTSGQLVNPSGNHVPVSAVGRISALNTAKAVGKVIAQNTWPLAVGFALYDLFKELGYDAVSAPDGSVAISRETYPGCTSSCYEYHAGWSDMYGGPSVYNATWFKSPAASCAFLVGKSSSIINYGVVTASVPSGTTACVLTYVRNGVTNSTTANNVSRAVAPYPAAVVSSSVQQFTDAVAAKSGWPTSSAISRVLADPAVGQVEKLPVESLTVTGPASSLGKQVVTDNGTTTTTETTTHNHIYTGDTINTTTTVTNVTVDNSTGAVINTTVQTDSAPTLPAPEVETCGLPGKPQCNVKIDESGTDVAPDLQTQIKVDAGLQPITDFLANPSAALPTFPTLNFGFVLPSGCTAVTIPAFSPWLDAIDVCQFQPMFHEIMSLVWVIGGIFGAMGMFFRNTFATV